MGNNILVTGGAGFIGSHLCDALIQRGDRVWCLDNLRLGKLENINHLLQKSGFEFIMGNILDKKVTGDLFSNNNFDAVFHLAANSDIREGASNHRIDLDHTFLTTFEILEKMLEHGVKKIVFASSSAVFGEISGKLKEESGPLRPVSMYGAAKLASEAYLSVFSNNYGFNTRILRFPNVTGERSTHGVAFDFIRKLEQDPSRLPVLGDGTQSKPYIYVKDLVKAMLLVFDNSTGGFDLYHVSGEGTTTVSEIAEIVIEEMGLTGIPVEYGGSRSGWVGDVPEYSYDNSKIIALGFIPTFDSTGAVRKAVRMMLGKKD
jgi:UDP-glucose 4-epimerase